MADPVLQYWDSVVFISYITGRDPERKKAVQMLLRHVERGAVRLVTSTFTLAEVRLFATDPRVKGKNDPESEARVDELFGSDEIEFRAVTDFIGRDALQIGRGHIDLPPADCVHIATAVEVGADVLFTWDGAAVSGKRAPDKMLTYDGMIGDPPMRIAVPYDPWETLGLADGDIGTLAKFDLPNVTPQPFAQSPDVSQE